MHSIRSVFKCQQHKQSPTAAPTSNMCSVLWCHKYKRSIAVWSVGSEELKRSIQFKEKLSMIGQLCPRSIPLSNSNISKMKRRFVKHNRNLEHFKFTNAYCHAPVCRTISNNTIGSLHGWHYSTSGYPWYPKAIPTVSFPPIPNLFSSGSNNVTKKDLSKAVSGSVKTLAKRTSKR